MISTPRFGLLRNVLKQGWPLLVYLAWETLRYAQGVLEAGVWSGPLVSSGVQLLYEALGLAFALSLMALQDSSKALRWPFIQEYSEEASFLGPLFLWLLFVVAIRFSHSLAPPTLETIVLTVGGLFYGLWLVWLRRREKATLKPFEEFRAQLQFPVTRITDSLARILGGRITTATPREHIDQLKVLAMKSMLKRFSLYVYGDERGVKMLTDLQDIFPGKSKLELGAHALYRLQEAYGADRFALMATSLADAYESTVASSKVELAAMHSRLSAEEFDCDDAEAAEVLSKEIEGLKIGPRVQEAFTDDLLEKLPSPNPAAEPDGSASG